MKHLSIITLSIISLNLFPDSTLVKFNTLIKNDLTFKHKSLDFNNELSESLGNLIHKDNKIIINIESPYKERYQINEKTIDVYDFDFEQSRSILIDEFNIGILDYLINGILDKKLISNLSSNSITLEDNQKEIYIELVSNDKFFIKYKDNIGITNLVDFEVKY